MNSEQAEKNIVAPEMNVFANRAWRIKESLFKCLINGPACKINLLENIFNTFQYV
jgi:hypothetical protein